MIEDLPEEDDQQPLFVHHHFIVDKGQNSLRIDKFLTEKINTSRNKIQNAARAESILVNGKAVKPNFKIKPLDDISIVLPYPKRQTEIIPQNIPLNIFYEDNDLMVINKAAGMVVHPGHGNYSGTLVNAVLFHINSGQDQKEKQDKQVDENTSQAPLLVHRIDKDTTGLIVVAKNEVAMIHLAKQFFEKSIERKYVALVWGDLKEEEGTITGHIGRSSKDRTMMQVFPEGEHGKAAVTHYKVLERFGYVTLVECQLETGRTHQIRAHFRYLGHPLFNDERYGGDAVLKGTVFTKYKQFVENCFKILPRQALHAKSLGFIHPTTKEELFFESELPDDMREVIERWRNYSANSRTKMEERE